MRPNQTITSYLPNWRCLFFTFSGPEYTQCRYVEREEVLSFYSILIICSSATGCVDEWKRTPFPSNFQLTLQPLTVNRKCQDKKYINSYVIWSYEAFLSQNYSLTAYDESDICNQSYFTWLSGEMQYVYSHVALL